MHRSLPRVTIAALALFGLGCDPEPEPTLGMVEGEIVARDVSTPSSMNLPTIHVREAPDECGIIFAIYEKTVISKLTGQPATLGDLQVGRRVRVGCSVIMESCPGQSSAETITILE